MNFFFFVSSSHLTGLVQSAREEAETDAEARDIEAGQLSSPSGVGIVNLSTFLGARLARGFAPRVGGVDWAQRGSFIWPDGP